MNPGYLGRSELPEGELPSKFFWDVLNIPVWNSRVVEKSIVQNTFPSFNFNLQTNAWLTLCGHLHQA